MFKSIYIYSNTSIVDIIHSIYISYYCKSIHHKNSIRHGYCIVQQLSEIPIIYWFGLYIEELERFIEEFEIFLTIIKRYKKSAFICADFNINLLEINSNRRFNTYFESIIAKGFFPRITLPTRI